MIPMGMLDVQMGETRDIKTHKVIGFLLRIVWIPVEGEQIVKMLSPILKVEDGWTFELATDAANVAREVVLALKDVLDFGVLSVEDMKKGTVN